MKKLIDYPEEIDNILKEYKKKTGMSVAAYIQRAIYKAMVHDKLINIRRLTINLDKEGNVVNIDELCDTCKYKIKGDVKID